jgi:hypothetical protein
MANLFSKLSPHNSWPTADATVDSCEWVRYHDHLGGTAGHYQVKFSYTAPDGQLNHGEFCHEGVQHIAPYRTGERLPVQYDPRKPARHRLNGASPNYEKLEAILVMTVFALLAGYVLYAF